MAGDRPVGGARHVAVPGAGGPGLGAGLVPAGPADAGQRPGQARLHHGLRLGLRAAAGQAAGQEGLPGAGRLPDPEGGRHPAARQLSRPAHHPARRHQPREHPARPAVGAGRGGGERSLRAGEQRGGGEPHRPHRVDADPGFPAGSGRQHLRPHRGDSGLPAAAQAGARPRGQHVQRPGAALGQRGRLLRLQVHRGGLLRQPAAGHAPFRGARVHRRTRVLQDGRDQPGRHRGLAAAAVEPAGARGQAELRGGLLPAVPEGAAAHHELHLRPRPEQGDGLHGARAAGQASADAVQRRLGRQAALAARLLPAGLPGGRCASHDPAQAGPPQPLARPEGGGGVAQGL